jgi:hypothetical protein
VVLRIAALVVAVALAATSSGFAAQTDQSDLPANVKLRDVKLPAEKARILSSLQVSLTHIGLDAKVGECSLMIDYLQDLPSGKDSSFGAVCEVTSSRDTVNIAMCDDWMIGKFTLTPGSMNREQLGIFIESNCPPGG